VEPAAKRLENKSIAKGASLSSACASRPVSSRPIPAWSCHFLRPPTKPSFFFQFLLGWGIQGIDALALGNRASTLLS